LRLANAENARTIAGQIGSRIAQISSETQDDPSVRDTLVEVRKAAFDVPEVLTRRRRRL
jgi:hypothetical protein